ncbi:RNA-directed DNA polymerase, eukaryota, reverse transcriptase zinc-binding domain protein [Tanacetum coccineum]
MIYGLIRYETWALNPRIGEDEVREEQVVSQNYEDKANKEREDNDKESGSVCKDRVDVDEGTQGKSDGNLEGTKHVGNKASYASMAKNYQSLVNNELDHIPTKIRDDGSKVVIFDEDIVDEGRRKMWGKYGLRKITSIGNGNYVFKFNNEKGLQTVIENGVWIVNNKPMVVQKWDIDVDINKVEPDRLSICVKLVNLPLEAWTIKGLSVVASRLGKPVMMDNVTSMMYNQGRLGYTRVLIEVDVKKGLPKSIDIQYFDKDYKMIISKTVKVLYDWKPPLCTKCSVFGHRDGNCIKHKGYDRMEVNADKREHEKKNFEVVRNRRNSVGGKQKRGNPSNNNKKNHNDPNRKNKGVIYRVVNSKQSQVVPGMENKEGMNETVKSANVSPRFIWNVQDDILSAIKRTTNKFAVLQEEGSNPPLSVTGKWNKEMVEYYKNQRSKAYKDSREEMNNEDEIELDENDVFIDKSANASFMAENEVRGKRILESHMKKDRIEKICNKVFGNWQWQHNLGMSNKGCRIIVGWNQDQVQSNHGRDRKELWKELYLYKRMIRSEDWIIMGDMNVTLNTNEHSEGMSYAYQDMKDFQEYINEIEMEDLCSNGLQFTWTKSLKNPNDTILNKLDRVMCNSKFLSNYNNAFANFLPYGISDHSPTIFNCPSIVKKTRKAFSLANYITDKEEFGDIVKTGWEKNVQGYAMFQLVHKLKSLKPQLNKLNWKNGNLFNRVEELKGRLFDVQARIDKDPLNKELREEEVKLLDEYTSADQDEEKLLCQKAKVEWLRDRDRNFAYFHKILKERLNKSKIHTVIGTDGSIHENDQVGIHFVNHFENFLGSTSIAASMEERGGIDAGDVVSWHLLMYTVFYISVSGVVRFDRVIVGVRWSSLWRGGGVDKASKGLGDSHAILHKKAGRINFKDDFCNAVKEFFKTDDLIMLMLDHGDSTSITTIKKALEKFSKVSGLHPNMSKSTMFYGSLSEDEKNAFLTILPFKIGKMPVRYLGVPLMDKKIGVKD